MLGRPGDEDACRAIELLAVGDWLQRSKDPEQTLSLAARRVKPAVRSMRSGRGRARHPPVRIPPSSISLQRSNCVATLTSTGDLGGARNVQGGTDMRASRPMTERTKDPGRAQPRLLKPFAAAALALAMVLS